MAKVAIIDNVTGSALVKTGEGILWGVNVTQVGTGASSINIYDNTSAAGTKQFEGDGLVQGAFPLNDGNGGGLPIQQGIYCAVAGTTKPTVVVIYD